MNLNSTVLLLWLKLNKSAVRSVLTL